MIGSASGNRYRHAGHFSGAPILTAAPTDAGDDAVLVPEDKWEPHLSSGYGPYTPTEAACDRVTASGFRSCQGVGMWTLVSRGLFPGSDDRATGPFEH